MKNDACWLRMLKTKHHMVCPSNVGMYHHNMLSSLY